MLQLKDVLAICEIVLDFFHSSRVVFGDRNTIEIIWKLCLVLNNMEVFKLASDHDESHYYFTEELSIKEQSFSNLTIPPEYQEQLEENYSEISQELKELLIEYEEFSNNNESLTFEEVVNNNDEEESNTSHIFFDNSSDEEELINNGVKDIAEEGLVTRSHIFFEDSSEEDSETLNSPQNSDKNRSKYYQYQSLDLTKWGRGKRKRD